MQETTWESAVNSAICSVLQDVSMDIRRACSVGGLDGPFVKVAMVTGDLVDMVTGDLVAMVMGDSMTRSNTSDCGLPRRLLLLAAVGNIKTKQRTN